MSEQEDLLRLISAQLAHISFEPFPIIDSETSQFDPTFPGHQFVFSEIARTKRIVTYRITDTLVSGYIKATITYEVRFRMSRELTQDEMEDREMSTHIVESIMPFTSAIIAQLSSYSFDEPAIIAPFVRDKDKVIFHKDS